MRIALTSDFPSTVNEAVVDFMRSERASPRIAWVPPFTQAGSDHFERAREKFATQGLRNLDYYDIGQAATQAQLDCFTGYNVIYLTGGDPLAFRSAILRSGLADRLRKFLAQGGIIVAASGGAMQLTKNVSLFRLLTSSLDEVLRSHGDYEALGVVEYELLPHLNRMEPAFLERVARYSEKVSHDILALSDGAGVLQTGSDEPAVVGRVVRIRDGVSVPLGS